MSWEMLPDIAWKSAVTLGVTLALLAIFRRRSAAQRAWIAHIGLLVTLLLPLAMVMLPRWEVESAPVAELTAPVAAIFDTPVVADAVAPALMPLPAPAEQAVTAFTPDPALIALLLWGLPALALLLAMLVAVTRLFALARRAAVMVEQSWLCALAQAQVRMNFKHGTALLVSREIASPVSWGMLRPVILINEGALGSKEDAEAIIAHELAHVSRLDWAGLLLARFVTALFWFNPLAWMVARQAHQLREEAADDAVLRSDVDRLDYAALLVGAARHEARGFLLAANGVAPSAGSLKRRITRVLDEHQLRAPAYMGWMSVCAIGAIMVALPLAAFSATRPADVVAVATAQAQPNPAVHFAYNPQYDAYVSGDRAAKASAPAKVAQNAAPAAPFQGVPMDNEGAQHAQAGNLARDIAEPEREKAQDTARREREKLFDLVKHALEGAQDAAVRAGDKMERAAKVAARAAPRPAMTIEGSLQAFALEQAARALGRMGQTEAAAAARAEMDRVTVAQTVPANAPVTPVMPIPPVERMEPPQANADKPTADDLIQMAILGISPRYRQDIAAAGYAGLRTSDLHQMQIHGVRASWLRALAVVGYDHLTLKQITNFAIHGVDADFALRMQKIASARPSPEQLVQLRIFNGRPPGMVFDKDKNKRSD